MAPSTRKPQAQPGVPGAQPLAAWSAALTESCVRTAQWQWDALTAWQRSLNTLGKEAWEQWACRFGGGVPIGA